MVTITMTVGHFIPKAATVSYLTDSLSDMPVRWRSCGSGRFGTVGSIM